MDVEFLATNTKGGGVDHVTVGVPSNGEALDTLRNRRRRMPTKGERP
jgi:hypothetical protein